MLCKSRGVNKLTNHIGDHALWLETKLDGERMLCHKDGRTVKYFTRNARDYTAMYGPVMTDTILRNVSQRGAGPRIVGPPLNFSVCFRRCGPTSAFWTARCCPGTTRSPSTLSLDTTR